MLTSFPSSFITLTCCCLQSAMQCSLSCTLSHGLVLCSQSVSNVGVGIGGGSKSCGDILADLDARKGIGKKYEPFFPFPHENMVQLGFCMALLRVRTYDCYLLEESMILVENRHNGHAA